jgi:hypothetical protein
MADACWCVTGAEVFGGYRARLADQTGKGIRRWSTPCLLMVRKLKSVAAVQLRKIARAGLAARS